MAKGIKDKVVIIGMGCSKFGERWDKEADNLMVEAYTEAIADAGIDTKQIDAAWLATAIEEQHVGKSATPLAQALRLPFIPVTRVENYCASGTEAFRGAVYAVASGAADVALALGVEKLPRCRAHHVLLGAESEVHARLRRATISAGDDGEIDGERDIQARCANLRC